jgi:hypothetical protein
MSDLSGQQIPAWLRSSAPPIASAQPEEKIRWVRSQIRKFARVMALERIYQLGPDEIEAPFLHVLEASVGFSDHIGLDFMGAYAAFHAEWIAAQDQARLYADALRRAIWILGRDRAPGNEILERAISINSTQHDRFGIDLASDDLLSVVKMIAVSAATGRRSHG